MYYPIIRQCIQALKNLETWLDKAEQHAAAKGFDVGVLLTSRLAPEPSLISQSTSRRRTLSASPCRPRCSPAPMRLSNSTALAAVHESTLGRYRDKADVEP